MKKRVGKGDKKKKGQNSGNLPTQQNFEWENDKNFGDTYSDVLKMSLYISKKRHYMFSQKILDCTLGVL